MENMKQTKYDKYYVTKDGKVWSEKVHRFLTQQESNKGYFIVNLFINGKSKHEYVHRLVAETYIPNPDNLPTVNHKDENRKNNNVENLEWMSYADNNNYGGHNKRASETKKITMPRRGQHVEAVAVNMCNKETHEIIKTFDSMASAADFLKLDIIKGRNGISACIQGRQKSAWGYWWERAKKIEKNT